MIHTYIVRQKDRYTPVAEELEQETEFIQNTLQCDIISIYETKVNPSPNLSNQAFIIIYKDR